MRRQECPESRKTKFKKITHIRDGEQTFHENIDSPPSSYPRGVFAKIAREFQIIFKLVFLILNLNLLWVVFSFQTQLMS